MLKRKRTHYCGELRMKDVGQEVVLMGWVQRRRDHGGLIFIDLRDRTGLIQIVFSQDIDPEAHQLAHRLRNEYVICVTGKLRERPEDTVNPNIPTGEVEVEGYELQILNTSETPPFMIEDNINVAEEIKLRYRYLDLRRPRMFRNLLIRHRAALSVRRYMDEQGFLEIETPVLTKSTPEGARDFLIPSRLYPGKFYAMPQSPQLFKQMLMIAGIDKYFQIVKCYRDEDLRADRQPEFTQIDIEMSFADQDDIFSVTEGLVKRMFEEAAGIELETPFPRYTYRDVMSRYGSDKPDTRFGMELVDVSDIVADSEFRVFTDAVKGGGEVKGLVAPGCAKLSRSQIDDLTEFVKIYKAKGLAWMRVRSDGIDSPIKKFFPEGCLNALMERMKGRAGDMLFFVADKPKIVADALGNLRLRLGEELKLMDESRFNFLWVTDFPLFQWNEEESRWDSEHHPFTAPNYEDLSLLDEDPGKVRSQSYDLVVNGTEVASGSVRIHDMKLQRKIFEILRLSSDAIEVRFGFFLEALKYGAPPHAGIALGFDRLVMMMAGGESLRDVIPFPKTQRGICLVTGAPARVAPEQLEELHISVEDVEEE
jgi:aspartyl-tRNA synthetase